MVHINCPKCGRLLLKGEAGASLQVKCGKCKTVYSASFKGTDVIMEEKKA